MASGDTIVEYEVKLPEPKVTKVERERAAFQRLLPALLDTHKGKHVAIHDERVVAVADELLSAAKEAWAKVGYQDLYVGLVTDQPEPVEHFPSFRVIEEN